MAIDATCLMRVQSVRRIICLGGYSGHGHRRVVQRRDFRSLGRLKPWEAKSLKLHEAAVMCAGASAAAKLSLFTDARDKPTISTLGLHRSLARLAGRLTSPSPIEDFSCQ